MSADETKYRLIVITGFMGSGKSTAALALAQELKCEAIDLDQLITERTGRTPKEIIEQDGEPAFREIETGLLGEILLKSGTRVVALGGGAWTTEANRRLIGERGGYSVWLDAPFELCWQRIVSAGSDRPLAPDEERARLLYAQRRALYAQADLCVATNETVSDHSLALQIAAALRTDLLID